MANLIRSAKYGNGWKQYDLDAYNMQVQFEDSATFFGSSDMPLPIADEELLTTQEAEEMVNDKYELITLLDLAMKPRPAGESTVDDFAVELLKRLGYVKRQRVARTRKDIPFLVCGETRHVKTDVCLIERAQDDILLLLQQDKRYTLADTIEPQAQMIAEIL
ncbi:hypothetical protein NM688_g6765 [Phlebia brevispora]|uniref:Uncharacterized protein n=1 Tax=Phlebia brevispora TaxID=194682 RepID=A0ACC1SCS7_9APHY|nr:hypothetical protein NM688_g6765 [Phlebia brevispora]